MREWDAFKSEIDYSKREKKKSLAYYISNVENSFKDFSLALQTKSINYTRPDNSPIFYLPSLFKEFVHH